MRCYCLLLLVSFANFLLSHQYSAGAPSSHCASMVPGHGRTPQTSISPYNIQVSATTYNSSDSITVTVSGGDLKGLLLVAKDNSGNGVGSFSISDTNFQAIQCVTGGEGLTHKADTVKSGLNVIWIAPKVTVGDIKFFATFVFNYTTYWVNVTSPAIRSIGTSASTPAPPASGLIQFDDQCGVSKGCFSDCQNNKCGFLVTWRDTGSNIDFELVGRGTGSGDSWIAIGFSRDSRMGEDSVIECVSNGGSFQVQQTYNNKGYSNRPVTNAKLGLTNPAGEYKNGVIRCKISRQTRGLSDSDLFDLDRDWYILYAEGAAGTSLMKFPHTKKPFVSNVVADLQSFDVIAGQTNKYPLVKAHGSLMILSWVMLTGIGIVVARYFKNTWGQKRWLEGTCLEEKIRLMIHITCMVAALATSVVGFIIIFVEVEGYSNVPKREGHEYVRAHPVLGIIITTLVIMNPMIALFMRHLCKGKKKVLEEVHRVVGIAAYILSAICICFGFQLVKAGTPDYAIYIMIGYVVYVVLMAIALEVMRMRNKERCKIGVSSQKGLLFVHVTITISFAIALVASVASE